MDGSNPNLSSQETDNNLDPEPTYIEPMFQLESIGLPLNSQSQVSVNDQRHNYQYSPMNVNPESAYSINTGGNFGNSVDQTRQQLSAYDNLLSTTINADLATNFNDFRFNQSLDSISDYNVYMEDFKESSFSGDPLFRPLNNATSNPIQEPIHTYPNTYSNAYSNSPMAPAPQINQKIGELATNYYPLPTYMSNSENLIPNVSPAQYNTNLNNLQPHQMPNKVYKRLLSSKSVNDFRSNTGANFLNRTNLSNLGSFEKNTNEVTLGSNVQLLQPQQLPATFIKPHQSPILNHNQLLVIRASPTLSNYSSSSTASPNSASYSRSRNNSAVQYYPMNNNNISVTPSMNAFRHNSDSSYDSSYMKSLPILTEISSRKSRSSLGSSSTTTLENESSSSAGSSRDSKAKKFTRRRLTPRSKLGCWICRIKHLKCNEARPTCSSCARFGIECDYSPEKPAYLTDKNLKKQKLLEISILRKQNKSAK